MCVACLAKHFGATEEKLRRLIEEYRAYGCTLFAPKDKKEQYMDYTPMHGIGNSYVIINGDLNNPSAESVRLSKEYGTDGIILVLPSQQWDVKMRIFNADGSEAEMCGNGSRCVARYVVDRGIVDKDCISLETNAGVKKLYPIKENGNVVSVKVDMGVSEVMDDIVVVACDKNWHGTVASMGNPHFVVFCDDISILDLESIGPVIEHSRCFPNRVNTEFAEILSRTHLKMRVWERGSGETAACGTGACALAAVAVAKGYCDPDTDITVTLAKGDLVIRVCSDRRVYMTGKAEYCNTVD